MLATTLLDTDRYGLNDLSDLYHGRWGVEEVDKFHGRSERGVRKELYAHFNLIAMARLFSNHGDGILDEMDESDRPRMKTNFTDALAMLALNLKEMILKRTVSLAESIGRAAASILAVRARRRPGRSFPR